MRVFHFALRLALGCGLAAGTAGAAAHDTWFTPATAAQPGQLQLSTGNRYPIQEFNPMAASLVRTGCTASDGRASALRAAGNQAKWLDMRIEQRRGASPMACWAELKPFELDMALDKVEVYFAEIKANAAHRQAWAGMQSRGLPWRESYRKFARIELAGAAQATPAQRTAARRPVGMDLELVLLGDAPVQVGQALEFQLLRDGQPLAGFPLELQSERSPVGLWRETDAQGKLVHTLPFTGNWLLRGTDLRVSTQDADRWVSRFVTLAIEAR